jgi:hypothetical protein
MEEFETTLAEFAKQEAQRETDRKNSINGLKDEALVTMRKLMDQIDAAANSKDQSDFQVACAYIANHAEDIKSSIQRIGAYIE